jgi:hypothetical protein
MHKLQKTTAQSIQESTSSLSFSWQRPLSAVFSWWFVHISISQIIYFGGLDRRSIQIIVTDFPL